MTTFFICFLTLGVKMADGKEVLIMLIVPDLYLTFVNPFLHQSKCGSGGHQPVLHQDLSELASHRPTGRDKDGR